MLKKLLLADDSLTIQKVVRIVFANLDYQLLIADNGDAALTLAHKEVPDLVIADIGMPGKDGLELCQEIKNDPALSRIPVLLLPGAFENFDEKKALAVGADGWLTKPFESQVLINKVEELLAAASQYRPEAIPAVENAGAEPFVIEGAFSADDEAPAVVDPFGGSDSLQDPPVGLSGVEFAAEDDLQDLELSEDSEVPEAIGFEEAIDSFDSTASFAPLEIEPSEQPGSSALPADEEESADEAEEDIWDAVTFEEEDLQPETLSNSAVEETLEELVPLDEPLEEEPALLEEESALADEEPALVEEEPVLVEEEPALVEEEPALAEEASALTEEEPALVEEEPALVEEEPALVEEEAALTEEEPALVEEETALVEEEPALVEEEPALLEEEPALLEEEPALLEEASNFVFAANEAVEDDLEDDILELGEDDILELEDDAIIEEIPENVSEAVLEEFEFPDEIPAATIVDFSAPRLEEVEPLYDLDPAPMSATEEQTAAPQIEESVVDSDEHEFEFVDEPESDVKEQESPPLGAAQIAAQLASLDPAVLENVLKKVAGPMIEKLAARMLEEVIWEVVPDLAESMIKDEIRKIKDGAA